MNKEQQIKEIAEILKNSATESAKYFQAEVKKAFRNGAKNLKRNDCGKSIHDIAAEALFNAGYRKLPDNVILLDNDCFTVIAVNKSIQEIKNEAVKEFSERLKIETTVRNRLCVKEYDIGYNDGYSEAYYNFHKTIDELLKEYEK